MKCGQGYGTGVVADNCSDAAHPLESTRTEEAAAVYMERIQRTIIGRVGDALATGIRRSTSEEQEERTPSHSSPVHLSASPTLARSRSYRNIQEAEETTVFNRYLHQSTLANSNSKNTDSPTHRPKNKL